MPEIEAEPQVGGNRILGHMAPNFAPFRQKSLGDCTRPLLPTRVWNTELTKSGHVPRGTRGQHPAVSDSHPVVSTQSQLSTCEDARPKGLQPWLTLVNLG